MPECERNQHAMYESSQLEGKNDAVDIWATLWQLQKLLLMTGWGVTFGLQTDQS